MVVMVLATWMMMMVTVKARHEDCESNDDNDGADAGFGSDDV